MTDTIKGKRGGKRPGSGRKRGTPNKVTKALKDIASEYTEEALGVLVEVMRDHDAPHAVRVSAADKLLDRGHGRPAVTIEATASGTLDPEMMEKLKTVYIERMAQARERQRQLLIERGLYTEDAERRLSAPYS
jgi:uncharacterized protein (DUF885 family)